MFAFLIQVVGVAVEDRVYISDFGIKVGEIKHIELCFDTETTNVKNVQSNITLPAGLTIIDQSSNNWITPNAERGAGIANMNTESAIVEQLMAVSLYTDSLNDGLDYNGTSGNIDDDAMVKKNHGVWDDEW